MSEPKTTTTYVSTFSMQPPCKHLNGFVLTAKFWIFKKRYFACSDCWRGIPEATHKKLREIYDAH